MIKRVNSTNRVAVSKEEISIRIDDTLGDTNRTFDVNYSFMPGRFPADAELVLEATCGGSTEVKRFVTGTVAHPVNMRGGSLVGLNGKHIRFKLKVIDKSEVIGKLLGTAERIVPEYSSNKTLTGQFGLLPVDVADLGERLWKLEFGAEVFLIVNSRVPELYERIGTDPTLYAVIFPEVIRRVLNAALKAGAEDEEEDDSERWAVQWLTFGRRMHPQQETTKKKDEEEEQEDWVDLVVEEFCKRHQFASKFQSAIGSASRDES